jgi:hypothetical protein
MREKKLSPDRKPPARVREARKSLTSKLELIRRGVRRFILDDATLDEFRRAVRLAASEGRQSPNPLPGGAFRKIVRDAIAERKRNVKRQPRQ